MTVSFSLGQKKVNITNEVAQLITKGGRKIGIYCIWYYRKESLTLWGTKPLVTTGHSVQGFLNVKWTFSWKQCIIVMRMHRLILQKKYN